MSLVLNGNGTIQNLVAGGLPDGSVTADDIASLPAGSVLQVVHNYSNTSFSSSTEKTWLNTGVSVNITPALTSSKVLVFINAGAYWNTSSTFPRVRVAVGRDGSVFGHQNYAYFDARASGSIYGQQQIPISVAYLDSPASTSTKTYSVYLYLEPVVSGSVSGWGFEGGADITAMEIAA